MTRKQPGEKSKYVLDAAPLSYIVKWLASELHSTLTLDDVR